MPAKRVQVDNEVFEAVLSERQIQGRVKKLAREISRDYKGKNPIALCILNGAVFFYADLLRNLSIDCEVAFLSLSSYGSAKKSSGKVKLTSPLPRILRGRDVIVVEDIVDSGTTVEYLEKSLRKLGVKSASIVALLHKHEATKKSFKLDYVGFRIPNDYVIGYGLDVAQKKRALRDIYRLVKVF